MVDTAPTFSLLSLPTELIVKIFELAQDSDDSDKFVNLERVCHYSRNIVLSHPSLWEYPRYKAYDEIYLRLPMSILKIVESSKIANDPGGVVSVQVLNGDWDLLRRLATIAEGQLSRRITEWTSMCPSYTQTDYQTVEMLFEHVYGTGDAFHGRHISIILKRLEQQLHAPGFHPGVVGTLNQLAVCIRPSSRIASDKNITLLALLTRFPRRGYFEYGYRSLLLSMSEVFDLGEDNVRRLLVAVFEGIMAHLSSMRSVRTGFDVAEEFAEYYITTIPGDLERLRELVEIRGWEPLGTNTPASRDLAQGIQSIIDTLRQRCAWP